MVTFKVGDTFTLTADYGLGINKNTKMIIIEVIDEFSISIRPIDPKDGKYIRSASEAYWLDWGKDFQTLSEDNAFEGFINA